MTDQLKKDFTLKISQANRTQLIVILYEIFLIYIKEAEAFYKEGKIESYRQAVKKAKGCNKELMNALNLDYNVASMLLQLYLYINKELTSAAIDKNISHLQIVATIVNSLREAYLKVAKEDETEPVMDNAQMIYAGLTYGKNDLIENSSSLGNQRGFLI